MKLNKKMSLAKAKKNYSPAKTKKRLKWSGVKYVDTLLLHIDKIIKMHKKEQIRTGLLVESQLEDLANKMRVNLNYECEKVVVKVENGKYILFDGHHRLEALTRIGYTYIVVDVIRLNKNMPLMEIHDFKYELNEDYHSKLGNDENTTVKTIGERIKFYYPKESKKSSVSSKVVVKCFTEFCKKHKKEFKKKDKEIIIQRLISQFSSHKDSIVIGQVKVWNASPDKIIKFEESNNQVYLQNVAMGRNVDHPDVNFGYGGVSHLKDEAFWKNPIYLCSTNKQIEQNLREVVKYLFEPNAHNSKEKYTTFIGLWINNDCNGDIEILKRKREELFKEFCKQRRFFAKSYVNQFKHNYKMFYKKNLSKKKEDQIFNYFIKLVGFGGFIPQLNEEKTLVDTNGCQYHHRSQKDLIINKH